MQETGDTPIPTVEPEAPEIDYPVDSEGYPEEREIAKPLDDERLEEWRAEQDRRDEERVREVRDELVQKVVEDEFVRRRPFSGTKPGSGSYKVAYTVEEEMRSLGFERSGKYSDDEVEEMGKEVINNLNENFPGYNVDTRLEGAERFTFIADRPSFNEFALRYRFPGINDRLVRLLRPLPLPVAGFAFGGQRSVVNGGLPKFLVKRTMYHEDLHLASAGLSNSPINEGATEYYARQAATKEGFSQNVMNPFYFPRTVAYALMSRAVGEDIAKEAYFNGKKKGLRKPLIKNGGVALMLKLTS